MAAASVARAVGRAGRLSSPASRSRVCGHALADGVVAPRAAALRPRVCGTNPLVFDRVDAGGPYDDERNVSSTDGYAWDTDGDEVFYDGSDPLGPSCDPYGCG